MTSERRSYAYLLIFLLATLAALAGCASLPTDYEKAPSQVIEDTQDTFLATEFGPLVEVHPGESGFYPLISGTDALVGRIALIRGAERSLDVQYYIWHADTSGLFMIHEILQAADRGVRVRLLLDDLDTEGKDRGLMALAAHTNIEIRLYNPFVYRGSRAVGFATDLDRTNRRMHNKSLTADNQATVVGGRNVGNEYFGGESHAGFSDLDVLAIGPIVHEVSRAFDEYWNSEWVVPLAAVAADRPVTSDDLAQSRAKLKQHLAEARNTPYAEALRTTALLEAGRGRALDFSWGPATLVYDAPTKVEGTEVTAATHMGPRLKALFDSATQELLIVSPYFVPGDKVVEFLGQVAKRGVRVRILTNSLAANDVGVVHAGYMRYRKDLLKRGVELYEFKPTAELPTSGTENKKEKKWSGSDKASLHAKTFGVDRQVVFVGSFNLDPRSVALNTEMGVVFESPELAGRLGEAFDSDAGRQAYRVELKKIPASESLTGFDDWTLEWVTLEDGEEVRYAVEPETSWWQRFAVGFMSLFIVESFL
ncbi:MAG: hypothetical protein AMS22_02855 [Thiotrichales bacterium SG8_50]|nr:MAG: hypothetical protein AMS22_02855 [Thiotrichales bacterium SG8_50]